MNLQLVSEALFALGRRAPRLPFAFLRALPLGLVHALRAPGLRETFRVAARASYYRDAFAAARVDVAHARRPEDLGDFYLTPEVLKTRPEARVAGTAGLAIDRAGARAPRTDEAPRGRRRGDHPADPGRAGGVLGRPALHDVRLDRGGDDPRLRVHPPVGLPRERVRLLRGGRRSGRGRLRRDRADDGEPARHAADPLPHPRRGAMAARPVSVRAPVPPSVAAARPARRAGVV